MWIVGIYISPRSFNWRERRTGLGHVWIDEDAGIRPIFFATVCPLNGNRSRKKERKILLFILVTLNREGWREEKLGNRFELESGRIESAKNNFLSPSNPSYYSRVSVLLCRPKWWNNDYMLENIICIDEFCIAFEITCWIEYISRKWYKIRRAVSLNTLKICTIWKYYNLYN